MILFALLIKKLCNYEKFMYSHRVCAHIFPLIFLMHSRSFLKEQTRLLQQTHLGFNRTLSF